jgi:hypothetical protein
MINVLKTTVTSKNLQERRKRKFPQTGAIVAPPAKRTRARSASLQKTENACVQTRARANAVKILLKL